ncbi:MAG TPA: dTDP-4-dehydrorhamnose reductase [Gammaproteobacteria bacterium]|jgi:dTDP-4-dehydrorhamnose reductase|nr:dTDP-4-dehydrorhamnose reductase [Gammaproteobacteria bacterium]
MNACLPKICITGSQGQLARAVVQHASGKPFTCIPLTRSQLDITQYSAIEEAFAIYQPDIVINTAAYTAVDQAEAQQAVCHQVNTLGASYLAMVCQTRNIPLIHLSTDYVFSGDQHTPYREEDMPNPCNVYGLSKLQGEQAIQQYCEKHLILRVSGIFSEHGHNFVKTIQRLVKEKKELRIVADQITCPTQASDIAKTLLRLCEQQASWGVYHYCSTPPISWCQFAEYIIAQYKKTEQVITEDIIAISTAEYPTPAKRPRYSALDCTKIQSHFGISQPSWRYT